MSARSLHPRPAKSQVEKDKGQVVSDESRSLLDLMREVSEQARREILRASDENNSKPARKRA